MELPDEGNSHVCACFMPTFVNNLSRRRVFVRPPQVRTEPAAGCAGEDDGLRYRLVLPDPDHVFGANAGIALASHRGGEGLISAATLSQKHCDLRCRRRLV